MDYNLLKWSWSEDIQVLLDLDLSVLYGPRSKNVLEFYVLNNRSYSLRIFTLREQDLWKKLTHNLKPCEQTSAEVIFNNRLFFCLLHNFCFTWLELDRNLSNHICVLVQPHYFSQVNNLIIFFLLLIWRSSSCWLPSLGQALANKQIASPLTPPTRLW